MAASLEDVGKGPGGEVLRSFLGLSFNDNGTLVSGSIGPVASGDTTGVTDTPKLQAAIDAAAGGVLYLSAGTYYLKTGLVVNHPNTTIIGAGKNATTLVRAATTLGTVITNDGQDGTVLKDFAIDGGLSGFPTNANHGIRIFDSNNVLCQRLKITNYFGCSILCFTTTFGTKTNVVFDQCECDALGTGFNGFLIVDMDYPAILDCIAKNAIAGAGGPGYGLQLKNQCRYGAIEGGYAEGNVVGYAFGCDNSTQGVQYSRITGGVSRNNNSGFLGGYFDHSEVEGLVIVQQTGNLDGLRIQGTASNNAFIGINVAQTQTGRAVVRFDDTTSKNFVEIDNLDATTTGIGEFENTSADNVVVVRKTGSNRPASDKTGTSTGTGNSVWLPTRPQDQIRLSAGENMLAENFQREIGAGASALTQGTGYFMRLPLRAGTVVTNILFLVTTAAVGMTLSKVGLYKKDGTQLAVSTDQGVSWQSTGIKVNALTAPYTVPTDDVYFACVLSVGTTGPTVLRGGATGTQNAASSGGVMPYGAQAGLADLPSPATIVTTNGVASWVGAT